MTIKASPLLIIEKDKSLQRQLRWAFHCFLGYDVRLASNVSEGMEALRRAEPGVVLLDLGVPPKAGDLSGGMSAIQDILAFSPNTKIIAVVGEDDRAHALNAIRLGAYDFHHRPIDLETLAPIVARAYHDYERESGNGSVFKKRTSALLDGMVASSPQMRKVWKMVERVAPIDVTVLLQGGSGTGKERFAQAIHKLSSRSHEKIVAINCAAIPDSLLESELFGHEKGAFTGATAQKIGKIERANGGTLFLDEIGDLPLELQVKLLRFLQERVIERVGGNEEVSVDTRIICATHQDIEKMISEKTFREDLYYRIRDVTLTIPSLKDREGDAILLATMLLDRFCKELNLPSKRLSEDAIRAIEEYSWPGNVRELEGKVKRATIMSTNNLVTAEDLELSIEDLEPQPFSINLKKVREETERRVVLRALARSNNNITDAADLLGVARPTVYRILEKYNLKI